MDKNGSGTAKDMEAALMYYRKACDIDSRVCEDARRLSAPVQSRSSASQTSGGRRAVGVKGTERVGGTPSKGANESYNVYCTDGSWGTITVTEYGKPAHLGNICTSGGPFNTLVCQNKSNWSVGAAAARVCGG